MTDRDSEIWQNSERLDDVFEELCRDRRLEADSALFLIQEVERLKSLAHDFYLGAINDRATAGELP